MQLREGVAEDVSPHFEKGKIESHPDFGGTAIPPTRDQLEFSGTIVSGEETLNDFGGTYLDTDDAVEKMSVWLEEALTPQIGKWLVARADPKQSAFETLKWLRAQGVEPPELFRAYSLARLLEMRRKKIPIYPVADKWLTLYWQEVERLGMGHP